MTTHYFATRPKTTSSFRSIRSMTESASYPWQHFDL